MPIAATAVPAIAATGVAVANPTGQMCDVTVTGGTVQGILASQELPAALVTPPIPASTVTATNPNQYPVAVAIVGGTVTVVAVNGVTVFTATGVTAVVPPFGTIALTYSVVPTSWTWTPLFAGAAGNPLASPTTIPVQPGGGITLIYSAAPTWAWLNPITPVAPVGTYQAMNTALVDLEHNLPFAIHAMAGQPGLGIAVSN